MLYLFLLLVAVGSVYLFAQKLVYKRRLRRALGRDVEDRELTSITSWLDASPREGGEGR